jgi:hypothetical protein
VSDTVRSAHAQTSTSVQRMGPGQEVDNLADSAEREDNGHPGTSPDDQTRVVRFTTLRLPTSRLVVRLPRRQNTPQSAVGRGYADVVLNAARWSRSSWTQQGIRRELARAEVGYLVPNMC